MGWKRGLRDGCDIYVEVRLQVLSRSRSNQRSTGYANLGYYRKLFLLDPWLLFVSRQD